MNLALLHKVLQTPAMYKSLRPRDRHEIWEAAWVDEIPVFAALVSLVVSEVGELDHVDLSFVDTSKNWEFQEVVTKLDILLPHVAPFARIAGLPTRRAEKLSESFFRLSAIFFQGNLWKGAEKTRLRKQIMPFEASCWTRARHVFFPLRFQSQTFTFLLANRRAACPIARQLIPKIIGHLAWIEMLDDESQRLDMADLQIARYSILSCAELSKEYGSDLRDSAKNLRLASRVLAFRKAGLSELASNADKPETNAKKRPKKKKKHKR